MKKTEFPWEENSLDYIRLFAALQVALTHYLNLTLIFYENTDRIDPFLLGVYKLLVWFPGVIILFTISGFLMGQSLDRQSNRNQFLKRRFLRIYPGLWVNMLVMVGILLLVFDELFQWIGELLLWVMIQGFGVAYTPGFLKDFGAGSINGALWTIMVEVQIYLCIYVLWNFLKKRGNIFWILLTILAVGINLGTWFAVENKLLSGAVMKLADRTFLPYLLWFSIGFLVYRCRDRMLPLLSKSAWGLLLVFLTYQIGIHALNLEIAGYYMDLGTSLLLPLVVLAFGFRFGKHRVKYDISYGIFLYHWPLINLVFHFDLPDKVNHGVLFAGYIIAFLCSAYGSCRWVEKR